MQSVLNPQAMYDRLAVSFLQDAEDTVIAYEERGKGKRKRSQYDQGMEALSNMNRVQQAEMLYGEITSAVIDKRFVDKIGDKTAILRKYDMLKILFCQHNNVLF